MWVKSWHHLSQQKCWHLFHPGLVIESKCNAPPRPSGNNLKMDGQPLTEATKQNVQHHRNTSVKQKNPCFHHKKVLDATWNMLLVYPCYSICLGNPTSSWLGLCTHTQLLLVCHTYIHSTKYWQNENWEHPEQLHANGNDLVWFCALSLLVSTEHCEKQPYHLSDLHRNIFMVFLYYSKPVCERYVCVYRYIYIWLHTTGNLPSHQRYYIRWKDFQCWVHLI